MRRLALALLVIAPVIACAQKPARTTPPVERDVKGQTIISNQLPAADLTFSNDFHYLGSQVVNIYGTADAEQHIFGIPDSAGPVSRLYWVQFEHYLPTNSHTYSYRPDRTVDVGGLQFIYDVQAFSNYGGAVRDPRSDGAAVVALLTKRKLTVPARFARVRMFHLPTADHRSELMIIYGEALPAESRVPVSEDGVSLDTADPADAKLILQRALQGLTLRRHVR
jgi:hypothetical protein